MDEPEPEPAADVVEFVHWMLGRTPIAEECMHNYVQFLRCSGEPRPVAREMYLAELQNRESPWYEYSADVGRAFTHVMTNKFDDYWESRFVTAN